MSTNIIMPEMGEGVMEGTLVSWLKAEGDTVNAHDPILEIETDKVTVEVNSDVDGVLLKACVPAGQVVEVGTVLAIVGEAGEAVDDTSVAQNGASETVSPPPSTVRSQDDAPSSTSKRGTRVSPVVARMVEEHGLDLAQITGTGRDGRVTKKDVQAYLDGQTAQSEPAPKVDRAVMTPPATPNLPMATPAKSLDPIAPSQPMTPKDGDVIPLTGMRRAIAEHMVMSKRVSPHATTVFEFDFTAVAKHRAEHKVEFARDGIKLTYMPYLIMATVEALKQHPMVNATWTDEGILLKRDINIGMATAVPQGLLVPVIRHADDMNLRGLARQVNDLANRARSNKLLPNEVQGGTFTVTNHGSGGSLIGMPIINQPQVGILGVGVIEKRVKVINDAIAIRPCAYVSFSFDHRILDGATADAFIMAIKQFVENFQ